MIKLSLKNKKSLSIKLVSAAFLAFVVFVCSGFAQNVSKQTVITGDEMVVRKSGNVTVSKGNSKAVNGKNVITSDTMIYNKKKSLLEAVGGVKLTSLVNDGEPLKAFGNFAEYNIDSEKGKLWGANTNVQYFVKDSTAPIVLKAGEIYFNGGLETLSAFKDVEIITSSGTITGDKAVYDKKSESITVDKSTAGAKRPAADVYYDGRKGFYQADQMVLYHSTESRRIIMTGNVTGTIEMEDKIK